MPVPLPWPPAAADRLRTAEPIRRRPQRRRALTQQTDHQDLLTRLDAVTREIAPSLDHGLDAIGDPMALLLPPEQIAELRASGVVA